MQGFLKAIKRFGSALDLDSYAPAVIQHKAHKSPLQSLSIDEWPKSYALNDSLNDNASSLNGRACNRWHTRRLSSVNLEYTSTRTASPSYVVPCTKALSHSHHTSSPSPVRQLTSKIRKFGLIASACLLTFSRE